MTDYIVTTVAHTLTPIGRFGQIGRRWSVGNVTGFWEGSRDFPRFIVSDRIHEVTNATQAAEVGLQVILPLATLNGGSGTCVSRIVCEAYVMDEGGLTDPAATLNGGSGTAEEVLITSEEIKRYLGE